MKKVSNQELADMVNKSVVTINGWKSRFPELLELLKIGAFCKKNNITIEKLKKCAELQELAKRD